MKSIVLAVALTLSGFVVGQDKEPVQFNSIEEMLAYGKFTDSLKANFNAKDHIDSVFILLNEYRVSQGVDPVEFDKNLCKVADIQAEYNATNDIVTHDNVDTLNTLRKRGMQFGEYYVAAEVATMNHIHALFLTKRSISSAPMYNLQYCTAHAFIMKQPEYTRCGISLVQSKTDTNKFYTIIVFAIK
jgi:uncharacterized protein YkwD